MANLFDLHARGLLKPLMSARHLNLNITNEADVGALIGRNMDRPVAAGTALTNIWGTPDEFLSSYKNFNNVYQQMIDQELSSKGISEVKRRMLMVHKNTPSINVNILSYKNQQALKEMFMGTDLLNRDGLFSQFGAPGFLYPSDNQYRLGGKMLTDKSRGAHPFLNLLDTLNFNIDPYSTNISGISVGFSNLPSFEALDSTYRQGPDLAKIVQEIQANKRAAKLFVYDTESSGFGLFSQTRNLGAISSELDLDAAGNLKFGPMDTAISAHMSSAEMSDMTAIKKVGGVNKKINYAQYAFENERLSNLEELFDLSTQEGRQKATNAYKNFFSKALEHDYIVGHNIQFDVQRVMMSAGLIEEFAKDDDAMKLMADFGSMIKQGKVINTLDLLRSSQMQQAMESARAAGLTGGDAQKYAEHLIGTIYSNKALGKMGLSNVAPASIENALLSSNLIDLIGGSGTEGADLVTKLASKSGTHESITDAKITQYILRFVQSGDLRWGVPNTHPLAQKAAINAMKSSSFITLTRFADVQGMSNATLQYVQSDKGIEGVKLYDETRNETIEYNKKKKEWVSSRVSTDGSTVETSLSEPAVKARVLREIDKSTRGLDSELIDLGVGFQQQSRAIKMLENVGTIQASLSTVAGGAKDRSVAILRDLAAGTDSALDDAFLRSLGSTQEELGFNFYFDSQNLPQAMRKAMNVPMSSIGAAQKASYVKRLAEGGLANALLDPTIRRTAVELARATSDVPYLTDMIDAKTMVRKNLQKAYKADVIAGDMTKTQLDEFLALSDVDFARKYGSHISTFNSSMKNVSRAASELGVSFLKSQKAVATINKTGGLSVTVAPTEMLKKMKVTVDGRQVDFLSEEFLQNRRVNKFALSVAQEGDKKFANLILDSSVIDRTMSREIAQQYMDLIEESINLNDEKTLIDNGMFSAEQQITEYKTILSSQQQKDEFVEQLAKNIEERGIGVAGIGGQAGSEEYRVATALETIMAEKGQGIRNQTKAFDEGMQIELSSIDENLAEMQIRVQDEEIGIVRSVNSNLADFLEDTRRYGNESNCLRTKASING